METLAPPQALPKQPRDLLDYRAPLHEVLPSPRRRLPYIDGLRGVAMLMVLGFHCWLSVGKGISVSVGQWRFDVTFLLQHGYLGVHLFLVLSGFCLTYPLAHDGVERLRLNIGRFARRRAWRILPPYYVALAIFSLRPVVEAVLRSAVAKPDIPVERYTAAQVISHIFMVHNFSPAWVRTINGSFWSLALEWQLYMIFPLLVWSFRRFGLARTLAAVLTLTLAYRSWVYAAHVQPGAMPYTPQQAMGCCLAYSLLPGRLFEFVLGMVAAVTLAGMREVPSEGWVRWYRLAAVLLGLLGLCVAHGWSPFSPITDVIWGLTFFCLVMYAGGRSAAGGSWLDSRPLVGLGLISYSIYLVHEPLIRRIEALLRPLHLAPAATLLLFELVAAPLAIACGWLFFRIVEARFARAGGRPA